MNRAPKKLLDSVRDINAATLKAIQIRREKGLITATIDPDGKGSSYKYSPTEAMVYTTATLLENVGYGMDEAFSMARKTINHCFIESMIHEDFVWLVDMNGGRAIFIDRAKFSETIPPELGLEDTPFCKLSPKPGVFLFLRKDRYDEIERAVGNIYSVAYRNISAIIRDAVKRLNLSQDEVKLLESECRKFNYIRSFGTKNIDFVDFG